MAGFEGSQIAAVVAQPDGKVVAAGVGWNGGQPRTQSQFALARYRTDGTLDPSFGNGGKVTTAIDKFDGANALALQPDGKLVAAGGSSVGGKGEFALVRYNANGSLDKSFGNGGKVTTPIGSSAGVGAIAVEPNGKIVAAGSSQPPAPGTPEFALARYNADGSLDPSFGGGGTVTTAINKEAWLATLVLQPDGKLVAAGLSYDGSQYLPTLARYNANGSLDPTFGSGGIITSAFGSIADSVAALALQPDDKLVAVGSSFAADHLSYLFAVARYNPDGSLDASFGSGGTVTTEFNSPEPSHAMALQPDGKIIAAGLSIVGGRGRPEFGLVRYNTNGSLDTSFGRGGKVTTPIGAHEAYLSALALRPDGTIVAAGMSIRNGWPAFGLARYNANGTLDTSFGSEGKVTTDFRPPCIVPNITQKTLGEAKRTITRHNCSLGSIKHAASRTVRRERVISQKPKPGIRLNPGAKVSLVVSKGRH